MHACIHIYIHTYIHTYIHICFMRCFHSVEDPPKLKDAPPVLKERCVRREVSGECFPLIKGVSFPLCKGATDGEVRLAGEHHVLL